MRTAMTSLALALALSLSLGARAEFQPLHWGWSAIGSVRYCGYGPQQTELDPYGVDPAFVDIHIPAACPVAVAPAFVGGLAGQGVVGMLQSIRRNPGGGADLVYSLGYRPGAHLRSILLTLNAQPTYGPIDCTVTVLAATPSLNRCSPSYPGSDQPGGTQPDPSESSPADTEPRPPSLVAPAPRPHPVVSPEGGNPTPTPRPSQPTPDRSHDGATIPPLPRP